MTREQLINLYDQIFYHEINEIIEAKLKQHLRRYPKQSFEVLLIDYYGNQEKVTAYQLEKRLFPLAGDIYTAVILFVNYLDMIQLDSVNIDKQVTSKRKLPYIRRFCRAMLLLALESPDISLPGRKRIQMTLAQMLDVDKKSQQLQLSTRLPFDSNEVFSRVKEFLEDADRLADLPQFSSVYFTMRELEPIANQLEQWKLNPFSRNYLKKILDESKKQQIRRALQSIIYKHPIKQQAKQAYAIYLTLDTLGYDWIDHPFIRRFIANSYLEGKVEAANNPS